MYSLNSGMLMETTSQERFPKLSGFRVESLGFRATSVIRVNPIRALSTQCPPNDNVTTSPRSIPNAKPDIFGSLYAG